MLKEIAKYFLYSKPWQRLSLPVSSISLGSWSFLKADYCRKFGLVPLHYNAQKLWGKIEKGTSTVEIGISCQHATEIDYGYFPPKADIVLLAPECHDQWHRNLTEHFGVVHGSKIVGFEHGNTFGHMEYGGLFQCFPHCDEIVVATEASIDNWRLDDTKMEDIRLVSADTQFYRKLWEKNRDCFNRLHIETVMVMGFPLLDDWRFSIPLPGYDDKTYRLLEREILCQLRIMMKRSIYKYHPSTSPRKRHALVDEVSYRPFEKVYQEPDAYIFHTTNCSCFGLALMTNKPIILFAVEGIKYNNDCWELIEKRCRVVPTRFTGERFEFDEEVFVEQMGRPYTEPNDEYVRKYAFNTLSH